MAATKYLDYDGLLYFWGLLKGKLALKADAQSVSAGTYGPSADASPSHGGTFKVPSVQVTSQGIVTAISEKTITLPSDNNTDTLVTQNVSTANEEHPVLLTVTKNASTNQGAKTSIFASTVKVNPSTGTLTATKLKGAVEGKATSAGKLDPGASINGTAFTGESDITTSKWGTARNISISDSDGTNTGTAVSVDGSAAKTLKLPATIKASLTGNANTADKVNNDLVIKVKTGSTEGTDLYTFNGSAGKTLDIKQGSNITLTAASGQLTIAGVGDTKNTAGSTDSSSKLFIIGATSQGANPQTYSQDTAYVGTDGCLYSNSTKVATVATTLAGYGITDAYTKTEIDTRLTSAVNYKGSVATYNDLPNNASVGDMYNVTATDENYIWAGAVGTQGQTGYVAAHWDPIGALVNLAAISNSEIDTVVAS